MIGTVIATAIAGLPTELLGSLVDRAADFVIGQVAQTTSWKEWKSKAKLQRDDEQFLDVYVEALVAYSKKEKRAFLTNFFREKAIMNAIRTHWFGGNADKPFHPALTGLARYFTLHLQLDGEVPMLAELDLFEQKFREANTDSRSVADAETHQLVSNIDTNVKDLKAQLASAATNPIPHTPKDLTARIPTIPLDKIVGREAELADLHTRLFNHKQVVLVNGLGGIGKTTLAQAYLSKFYDAYQHVAWVGQVSESFLNDLVNTEGICHSLRISTEGKDLEGLFQAIIMELKALDGQPCLLVIDNADASLARFYDYLPRQPHWHILATSREQIQRFEEKKLDFLSEVEAVALFRQHYHLDKIAEADIVALVQLVDRHTLTIEILAKTAQKQRTTIAELQAAIQADLRANVYVPHKASEIERVTSYLNSIFNLSRLDENEAWLMQQLACLPAEYHTYDTLLELLNPAATEREAIFAETLQNLSAKGWLLHNANADAWKMHRIIAEVTTRQKPLTEEGVRPLVNTIAKKLKIDETKDNPIDSFPWVPFGRSLLFAIEHLAFNEKATLQNNLALRLQDLGDYEGAKSLLEKAVKSNEQNFGTEYPTTAVSYSNLALVLKDLGDYESAKSLLEKAMKSDEQNFGAEHPTTAVRYSNLATVLGDLGDYQGEKLLLEKTMNLMVQKFGLIHPNTAQSYSNLAMALKNLGDYQGAKSLLEKAVKSVEQNFGAEHPTTAVHYSNLALVLKGLGDYQGAKSLLEKAVKSGEQNFGAEHPKTAVSYSNLASVYFRLNQLDTAIEYSEKAYQVFKNHLGEAHPYTKRIKSNLDFYKQQAS